jgi:adenine-specific DNA-methyltransferase
MTKPKMHTPDLVAQNIEWVAARFPGCITESRNEKGEVVRAVDFDLLRQELSPEMIEGPQERYHLNWPGKREALLAANAPIAKTLRPCPAESVDFDTTKNLFIEGDNLDALKLLQDTYLSKIQMIYIDPPYNTGNDFVYDDDFSANSDTYLVRSNQQDQSGARLVANPESNGRFHSDWLTMMYPRLKLARMLLRDDGVLFISIDDGEVANLRKACDEVFGTDNFMGTFVWQRRVSSALAESNVSTDHEYVVAYRRTSSALFTGHEKTGDRYDNPDNDPRGPWIADNLTVGMNSSMRPNQAYDLVDPATGTVFPFNPNRVWAFIPSTMEKMIKEGRILFPKDASRRPMQKRFFNELKRASDPFSSLMMEHVGLNTEATRLMQDLFGANVFEYSKPLSLLSTLLAQACGRDGIVLDFFSGSSTTGHAVLEANARDGGSRRFILVQLPEACDAQSEAARKGYKTIADIGKERIRRAGKAIKDAAGLNGDKLDFGFRVLKVDTSNMKDVYYRPDAATAELLGGHVDNIKDDRSDEDLLFQVLLEWGVDLSLPIKKETMSGKAVYFVDENALAACFAAGIDEALVKALAARKPLRAVFRDSGYGGDDVKINVEQIFKQLSPGTEVKTL